MGRGGEDTQPLHAPLIHISGYAPDQGEIWLGGADHSYTVTVSCDVTIIEKKSILSN